MSVSDTSSRDLQRIRRQAAPRWPDAARHLPYVKKSAGGVRRPAARVQAGAQARALGGWRPLAETLLARPFFERRLRVSEVRRRAHHMLPGLLPLLLWIIPYHHEWVVPCIVGVSVVALAATTYVRLPAIQRDGESRRALVASIVGYAGSVLAALLLFPFHVEVAFLVLGVLAFGDGSATLAGLLFGRRRLPWNAKKSIVGTACFVVCGTLMSALLYWIGAESHPHAIGGQAASSTAVSLWAIALPSALVATVIAGIAESWPAKSSDNVRVGIAALVAASLAQVFFVGWM